jgi:hypothetical protein
VGNLLAQPAHQGHVVAGDERGSADRGMLKVLRHRVGDCDTVGVIEGFRAALLGTRAMPWSFMLVGGVVSVVLFVTGMLYFRRKEHIFADVA